jgi:hypothetical protein
VSVFRAIGTPEAIALAFRRSQMVDLGLVDQGRRQLVSHSDQHPITSFAMIAATHAAAAAENVNTSALVITHEWLLYGQSGMHRRA